jgi:hypothetical protein
MPCGDVCDLKQSLHQSGQYHERHNNHSEQWCKRRVLKKRGSLWTSASRTGQTSVMGARSGQLLSLFHERLLPPARYRRSRRRFPWVCPQPRLSSLDDSSCSLAGPLSSRSVVSMLDFMASQLCSANWGSVVFPR